ncbi:hypothetical protein NAEGRDRAFT_76458 [Naegleria gruberi]|uniref:Uncharacterized protein n=1 Tax=Naegleria gruberi TaxID=5762 RepID=D2W4X0_NAEGR|nr:uncharacterized protein NAEGRDRAFT_76458 [Naegleria gruberi]EFC35883.1 hypothetical protein NAEGRDRAFT_76458 [Naegleria gruberi]|eukprot:XP_002668627.1 hypothetical protein NAEGRDRAFT_76458 [Naegleria gruberi strain NEG-M]
MSNSSSNEIQPHVQAISNLSDRIASTITSLENHVNDHLSKEQLISIFFHDESEYQSSTLQYTAPFKATIRICTPPNDQESCIINSSEEFHLYVMSEHLLLFNMVHAYKIHFSDILMHGVQKQPQICMYCQLACDTGVAKDEKDESQMDEDDDEGFESVCEMIIQLQVQSSALEQIYNQMYQAFSRAAENVPLSDMQDDDEK